MKKKEKDEMDIYAEGIIEELVEDDAITAEEEGFMSGYIEA